MSTPNLQEQDFSTQFDWQLWRRVAAYLRPYRMFLVQFIGLAMVVAACEAAYNLMIKYVIDEVAVHGLKANLWQFALIYFGITVVVTACIYGFIVFGGRLSTRISHDVRRAGFERLQALDFAYFDQRPTGWLMARMTSDCDRFANILTWGSMDIIWGFTFMLGIGGIMLMLHWKLALIVMTVMPVMAVTGLYFQRKLLRSARDVRKLNSRLTASYNEELMGVATTKTLVREEANLREFVGLAGGMRSAAVRNGLQSALLYPALMVLGSIGSALALMRGGSWALEGALSVGTLVAFIAYSRDFFIPIIELSRRITEFQMAQAAAERVISLIETEPKIVDSPAVRERVARAATAPRVAELATDGYSQRFSEIEFRHVDFGYKPERPVLHDFNLRLRAGERIALVGPTGGGKSTIVSLLCRFYEPTSGEILFDGIEYRERSLQWLQSNLGIVLQTPHLFSGSIRENIRYGRLRATDAEVEEAAQLVHAHEFITGLPNGYASEVGQGGVNLSTGQKQLISFARAVLADPQIFVMDEATSSVDTPTEHLIQAGLERVMQGRTSFIIAHRLSTIRHADRILVIENGHIAEMGNHHELINRHGHYHQLYTEQFTSQKHQELLGRVETQPA
jgi:ATP-binding cassette subfamily B protein